MKVHKEVTGNSIPVREMSDGQIAVITRWGSFCSYVGRVVQRADDKIISVGMTSGNWWGIIDDDDCRVCILGPGTLLEI